jgi:predicted DNA binding CopG/RHH family protein
MSSLVNDGAKEQMMTDKAKIAGTEEAWDSEQLGAEEGHVQRVPADVEQQIEESLGMQMISIRLDKSLIESYKLLAAFHGVGYQPLMRDALKRFADGELKAIVAGMVSSQRDEMSRAKPQRQSGRSAPAKSRKAA